MQTQRLMGQQSLGGNYLNYILLIEFMGLHVDLESVFMENI
jgi:hypothetical protein